MIEQAVIISLVVTAVYACFQDGMIFSSFKHLMANFLDKKFGLKMSKIIQKPLWDCLVCMTFWWGLPALIVGFKIGVVIIAMGISAIIDKFLDYDV